MPGIPYPVPGINLPVNVETRGRHDGFPFIFTPTFSNLQSAGSGRSILPIYLNCSVKFDPSTGNTKWWTMPTIRYWWRIFILALCTELFSVPNDKKRKVVQTSPTDTRLPAGSLTPKLFVISRSAATRNPKTNHRFLTFVRSDRQTKMSCRTPIRHPFAESYALVMDSGSRNARPEWQTWVLFWTE